MFKELAKGIRVVTSRYVREVKEVGETKLGPHKQLMLWDFTKEDTLKYWDCISDADIDGHSCATLEKNKRGKRNDSFTVSKMFLSRWGCIQRQP